MLLCQIGQVFPQLLYLLKPTVWMALPLFISLSLSTVTVHVAIGKIVLFMSGLTNVELYILLVALRNKSFGFRRLQRGPAEPEAEMVGHLAGIEAGEEEEGDGDLASKGMTEEQLHAAVAPLTTSQKCAVVPRRARI